MSLELSRSGGLNVKTRPDYSGPDLPQLMVFEDQEITIAQTLAVIKETLKRSDVSEYFAVHGLSKYFRSLKPVHGEEGWRRGEEWIMPPQEAIFPEDTISDDSEAPDIELLGYRIAGCDLPALIDYVLTNTPLTGVDDPRLEFLAEL